MKALFFILMLLPGLAFAQKYNFQGEYRLSDIAGSRQQTETTDTIVESLNFKDDSVKIGCVVMPPNATVPASRHYSRYVHWKITRQETSQEKDKSSGKVIFYEQMDVTINGGRKIGYFQYASSRDPELRKKLPPGLIFIHDGRIFLKK